MTRQVRALVATEQTMANQNPSTWTMLRRESTTIHGNFRNSMSQLENTFIFGAFSTTC